MNENEAVFSGLSFHSELDTPSFQEANPAKRKRFVHFQFKHHKENVTKESFSPGSEESTTTDTNGYSNESTDEKSSLDVGESGVNEQPIEDIAPVDCGCSEAYARDIWKNGYTEITDPDVDIASLKTLALSDVSIFSVKLVHHCLNHSTPENGVQVSNSPDDTSVNFQNLNPTLYSEAYFIRPEDHDQVKRVLDESNGLKDYSRTQRFMFLRRYAIKA